MTANMCSSLARTDDFSCSLQRCGPCRYSCPHQCMPCSRSIMCFSSSPDVRPGPAAFPDFCGRWRCDNRGVHNNPFFEDKFSLLQELHYLTEQFLLQLIAYQQIPKTPQSISIRYLVTGVRSAEIWKSSDVYDLSYRCFVCQIIPILQQIDPQHTLQIVGLIAALPIIVRLNECEPPAGRCVLSAIGILFLCPYLHQFVAQASQPHLLIHTHMLPLLTLFCISSVRYYPKTIPIRYLRSVALNYCLATTKPEFVYFCSVALKSIRNNIFWLSVHPFL